MSEIVGIDLGTTNSLIAVFRDGRPQLISNVHGDTLTPSVVGVLPSGEVIVGSPAKELRVTEPHRCAATFKRLMGQNQSLKLGGKSFIAPELSAMVLRSLKCDAETFLGETVSEAVITVPAYFNDHQRKATRLAGELAGLKVRRIVNEPTAAALAYGFHDRQARKKLLVIDLGGGTFDVTLMDVFEGALEIISTAGENFLGGEDFTDRLASAVLSSRNLQFEVMEQRNPLMVSRLREECEAAKRILSTHETAAIRIPDPRGILDSDSADFVISRSAFTEIVRPLLDRLRGPIDKALHDGRCARHEVDEVILAGGATRMPAIADLVRDDFGRIPCCSLNPDEVVALGAAVQAALIVDDVAVEDVVMTDVCPHTLGVAIVKEFGGHLEEGYFSPVIHRNTTIPVSREERYATVHPHQTSILLQVYQGEARRVKDNLLLGQLTVDGIPPGPPGQPIEVRFTYDLNGILEVEAYVPGGGRKFQAILNHQSSGLSNDEIREAVKRMQAIKFYPRDDLRNQRLVLFCERLVGEVGVDDRDRLEAALDLFEQAMSSGDRDRFSEARRLLIHLLLDLGIANPEPDVEEES